MPVQQHILNWLYSVLTSEYHDVNRTYNDVAQALARYPSLAPRTDVHTFPNGASALLLHITGTIPVNFRGSTYRFPLSIWVPHAYPREPPIVYVTPTETMMVRPGQHVDPQGQVYHPYLVGWVEFWDKSTIQDFLGVLSDVFAKEPPVISRQQPPPAPRQQPTQSPPPVPPLPPEMTPRPASHSQSSSGEPRPPPPPPKPHQSGHARPPAPSRYDSAPALPPYAHTSASPGQPQAQSRSQALPPPQQHGSSYGASPPPPLHPQRFQHPPSLANSSQAPPPHTQWQQTGPPPGWSQAGPPHQVPQLQSPQLQQRQQQHQQQQQQQQRQQQQQPPQPPPNLLDEPLTLDIPTHNISAPPIPPNPEKDMLLRQLAQTLYSIRQRSRQQNDSSMTGLQAQRSAMMAVIPVLHSEMGQLTQLSNVLQSNASILHDALHKADGVIEGSRNHPAPDVDELLVAPTVVSNQLYTLVAEERALGDAIFMLGRAVERGRISPAVFAKMTRSLAREWYLKKALARKIGEGMGMIS